MAEENDNSQEKTEEATPRRLEKAREEGQTARSRELATMAVLLAGAGGLLMFGSHLGAALEAIMKCRFEPETLGGIPQAASAEVRFGWRLNG